jgi:PAS domain S-box-containing protein
MANNNAKKKNGDPVVGIYEVDFRTGLFVNASQRVASELGYKIEELEGKPVEMIMTEESKELFRKRVKEAMKGKMIDGKVEYEVITKSGTHRFVRIEAFYKIENRRIVGALVAVREVKK